MYAYKCVKCLCKVILIVILTFGFIAQAYNVIVGGMQRKCLGVAVSFTNASSTTVLSTLNNLYAMEE